MGDLAVDVAAVGGEVVLRIKDRGGQAEGIECVLGEVVRLVPSRGVDSAQIDDRRRIGLGGGLRQRSDLDALEGERGLVRLRDRVQRVAKS